MAPTRTNPFSTRYTRPGSLPFLGDAEWIESIISQVRCSRFVGQITGPHGCGKTTLSHTIARHLQPVFQSIRHLTLRGPHRVELFNPAIDSGHRSFQTPVPQSSCRGIIKNSRSLLVIDGIETLSIIPRWTLIASCRAHRHGLILTTHRPIAGIPIIATLVPQFSTFCQIVSMLAPDVRFDSRELEMTFRQNHENIRESLMAMYDQMENQFH